MDETRKNQSLTTADLAAGANRKEGPQASEPQVNKVETGSPGAGAARAMEDRSVPLFSPSDTHDMRERWNDIQASFVDEPRKAVQEADQLVASTIKRLAEIFSNERTNLEKQWGRGDNVSTEDLRQALRRYRSFFDRLLSV